MSLLDVWDETEVLTALSKDPYIQKQLKGQKTQWTSLAELYEQLENSPNRCSIQINQDAMNSFVFDHVKKDQIAVHIYPREFYCRFDENLTGSLVIGIYLPIKPVIKDGVIYAQKNKTFKADLKK